MARPISDEELELKKRARRRLVGAIVLVTAVAVILPMVLDSEPKPVSQNVDIQIPSPDASEFKPKGASSPPTNVSKAAPPAAAPADTTKLQMDPKVAAVETENKASEAKAPESKPAATGSYVIQVEALSDATKARRLQEKVAGAGLPAYTEVVSTKSGELTRVRAGPYATREAAEKARTQLKKAGLDGKVVAK